MTHVFGQICAFYDYVTMYTVIVFPLEVTVSGNCSKMLAVANDQPLRFPGEALSYGQAMKNNLLYAFWC